jgi:hypothetical protein
VNYNVMTGQSEEIEDTLNNDEMLSDQGGKFDQRGTKSGAADSFVMPDQRKGVETIDESVVGQERHISQRGSELFNLVEEDQLL